MAGEHKLMSAVNLGVQSTARKRLRLLFSRSVCAVPALVLLDYAVHGISQNIS